MLMSYIEPEVYGTGIVMSKQLFKTVVLGNTLLLVMLFTLQSRNQAFF